jgi:uncharacterized protein YjeT (DUF2065 family)
LHADRAGPERPLSISIIGWVMIASGLFGLLLAFLHVPLSVFGAMIVGRVATAGIFIIALAYVLIGYGLLHLKPAARVAGIALLVLLGLNGLVITFFPDTHARMLSAMKDSPLAAKPLERPLPPSPIAQLLRIPMFGVVIGVPLWFLLARRSAFDPEKKLKPATR